MNRVATDDRDFDIHIRAQALASLAGRQWPSDPRGLAMAEQWFSENGQPIAPIWFSSRDTGIYGTMAAAAHRYLRDPQEVEDLLQDIISGLSLRSHPYGQIGYAAERTQNKILAGSRDSLEKFKALMIRHTKQRATDRLNKAKPGDYGAVVDLAPGQVREEVPYEVGSGELLYKDEGVTRSDFGGLISLLVSFEGSRTGRLLKQWLVKTWERGGATPALLRVGEAWLEDPANINYSQLGTSLGVSGNAVKKSLRKLWEIAKERYERDSDIQDFVESQVQRGQQDFRPRFASHEKLAFRFLVGQYLDALDAVLTHAEKTAADFWNNSDVIDAVEAARSAVKRGHWAVAIRALDGMQHSRDSRLARLASQARAAMDEAAYGGDPKLVTRLLDAIVDHIESM